MKNKHFSVISLKKIVKMTPFCFYIFCHTIDEAVHINITGYPFIHAAHPRFGDDFEMDCYRG